LLARCRRAWVTLVATRSRTRALYRGQARSAMTGTPESRAKSLHNSDPSAGQGGSSERESAMPLEPDTSTPAHLRAGPAREDDRAAPAAGRHLLFLREEELRLAQDLLFFGYRDFTAGADAILAGLDMGRAHHRVLHFVGRRP